MSVIRKKIICILAAVFFLFALPAYAQNFSAEANQQTQAFAGGQGANFGAPRDPRAAAAYTIRFALGLLGMAFLGYTVYAGYLIMMARGNEEDVTKGKETLKTAVIGLVLILASYSITLLVAKIATNKQSAVEPILNNEQPEGLRIRPDPKDFMPSDPLR